MELHVICTHACTLTFLTIVCGDLLSVTEWTWPNNWYSPHLYMVHCASVKPTEDSGCLWRRQCDCSPTGSSSLPVLQVVLWNRFIALGRTPCDSDDRSSWTYTRNCWYPRHLGWDLCVHKHKMIYHRIMMTLYILYRQKFYTYFITAHNTISLPSRVLANTWLPFCVQQ